MKTKSKYKPAPPMTRAAEKLTLDHLDFAHEYAVRNKWQFPQWFELDDLKQHAVLGLIKAANTFDPDSKVPFKAWATLKMRFALFDIYGNGPKDRKQGLANEVHEEFDPSIHQIADRGKDPEVQVEEREKKDLLLEGIASLSRRDQRVLKLRYFKGCKQREVGKALKVNESRACQLEHRAVDRLREVVMAF